MFCRCRCSCCRNQKRLEHEAWEQEVKLQARLPKQTLVLGQHIDKVDGIYRCYYREFLGRYQNIKNGVIQLEYEKVLAFKWWVKLRGVSVEYSDFNLAQPYCGIVVENGIITHLTKHRYYHSN